MTDILPKYSFVLYAKFEFIYYEPLRLQRLYLYNFFAVLNLIV